MITIIGSSATAVRHARRLFRPRRKPPMRPVVDGLPDGLSNDVFVGVVTREMGTEPTQVQHRHLSGWKRSGAYRLFIDTDAGPVTMVFKDAHYSQAHVAAIQGLPVRPGPPELAVCTSDSTSVGRWVPRTLWYRKEEDSTQYRYLFEDLGVRFRNPTSPEGLVTICSQLPRLHTDLAAAFNDDDRLLRYDDTFGDQLLDYAHAALGPYSQSTRFSREARQILAQWATVERCYLSARTDAFEHVTPRVVHGDLNLANAFESNDQPHELRLIDWEWAGFGLPQFDLASALKRAAPQLEARAVAAYARSSGDDSATDVWRAYLFCKLERGLFDASFLSRQSMSSTPSAHIDLDRHVSAALGRVLRTLRAMQPGWRRTGSRRRREGSSR